MSDQQLDAVEDDAVGRVLARIDGEWADLDLLPADEGEARLRQALDDCRSMLAVRRAARDRLAEAIRRLVAGEEVLARAVAVFDRAKRNDGADA